MFKVGELYNYGGAVCRPHFKTMSDGSDEYLDGDCTLTNGQKSVPFISGVWEPVKDCVCKCQSIDPLVMQCDFRCLLRQPPEYKKWESVIRKGLKKIGLSVSDNECATIRDMYKWYFEVQGKADSPDVFVEFLLERLNGDLLQTYYGSCEGASTHEAERAMWFNIIFGVDNTPVIKHIVDKYTKCEACLIDDKIELYVEGFPYEQYTASVLMLTTRGNSVSSLMNKAEG